MATVLRKKQLTADEQHQLGIGGVCGRLDKAMEIFRPGLADNQKVGFFSQDRTSQTDVTEIINLKEMTDVLRNVLGDVGMLKREINLSKQIIKADYDAKLKNKAIELYSRVNERIEQVEKLAEERVDHIRRAFRQQLSNALTRLSSIYQAEMERRIKKLQKDKLGDAAGLLDKYNELVQINQRNESLIQMLRTQLVEEMTKPPPIQEVAEEVYRSSPTLDDGHEEALDELRQEIIDLETKVEGLVEQLDVKDEQASEFKMEIDNLRDALEREKITVQQLKHENEEMKAAFDHDKTASRRQAEEMMERQRLEMEKAMEQKMRQISEEMSATAAGNLKSAQDAEQNKIQLLVNENRRLEMLLAEERAKGGRKTKEQVDTEAVKKKEEKMGSEIERLKKEIDRVHRSWEKKFSILQSSLHALKDESYVRQSLQRQAAALHHAAISYAVDTPLGIRPTKQGPRKPPLPEIPKTGKSGDYYSYTLSGHSNKLSADEHQVMSDSEALDIPQDVPPLVEPPPRPTSPAAEDASRPSTSHVVFLPSAVET